MYDELVLLELKEFGGRTLVSIENDMKTDSADKADTVVGKFCSNIHWYIDIQFIEQNIEAYFQHIKSLVAKSRDHNNLDFLRKVCLLRNDTKNII